ncbi:MAG: RHS repeat-associated core domain-containing protein, partial [Eubacteriales bacterium]|nr:RHS repeat-associated core domain-containing protein [Eubacteriales bacterium]
LISILYPDRSTECFEYDDCGNIVRHIDKMGGITVNEYDAAGRRISMTDPRGSRWSYEYDECDRILKITDPMGNTRSYEYSATGRITAITDYDGSKRQWSYNVSDLAESYVDQNGQTTHFAYNEIDLLSEVILPGGGKIVHEYDGAGRKTATVDELGCRTTWQYNADGRITEESNGRYTRRFEYDPAGNVIQITDRNGSVSSVKRDAMGNVTELTRGDGTICRYEYDLEGQCTKKIDPTGAETEFDYDSCRRLTEVRRCGVQLRHYTYYPSGRVMDVKTADGVTEHYRYDECGNMTARESGTGYWIEYTYDALGRRTQMSDSEGRKVSYTYDASGRVTEHTDEKGNSTKFAYSPSGKMISVEDALTNRTYYEYDPMGRIQKIIAGEGENSRSTTLERNYKGLITRITDAAGNSSRYEYDEFGNMILHESAEDAHTLYTYNADGKPVKILYGDGNSVEMTYDPMGRMTAMTDWNGKMELEYDAMGRLTHVTDADGRDARYGWDQAGYMTSVQYPDGGTAEFEHDEAGRVRSIKAGTGEIRYAYDATGRLQRKETDGASVQYAYNPDGKVKSVEFSDREGRLSSLELQYDLGGNIAERKEWHRAEGEGTKSSTSYEYDALGRVTAVFMNGVPVRAYEYDAYGNRLSEKAADKEIHSTFNNLNQLVSREITQDGRTSTEEWRYNKDGHTVSVRGENTAMDFRYDQAARLAEVCHEDGRKTVYEYDGLGSRRAQKEFASGSVKSRQYFADLTDAHSAPLFMEEDGVGSDFIRDGEIAGLLSGGSLYFYQCDQQGSVYNYLGQDGSTLCEYRYDEFGNELSGSAGNRQPLGYTGLIYDAAGSSWMTPARTYAPGTGRFLQRDRERFIHIGNPQSVNLYTYCLNNPLLYIDPDGTDCYYFYLPEWENEAINDQRRLAEQYGYSTDQVHLIPITNGQELTDGWNAMGYENGRQVDIDTVVINTHADPEGLGFGQSGASGFTTDDARNLNNQSMEQLILYGCNAGHRDYMDTNIAEAFSHRTNNAPVMASDGTVQGMNSDETYIPINDTHFQYWARRAGNGGRDNEGWQVYQQVDGQTVVTNTGLRSLTIVGMLEALRSLAPTKESSE